MLGKAPAAIKAKIAEPRLVTSPFGHALGAARENERRALSLGFPVFWIRLGAFVISATIAGLAGYFNLYAVNYVAAGLALAPAFVLRRLRSEQRSTAEVVVHVEASPGVTASQFGVTIENDGGSARPTLPMVLAGAARRGGLRS